MTSNASRRPGPQPDPSRPRSRHNPDNERGREGRKNVRLVEGGECRYGHKLEGHNILYERRGDKVRVRCRLCSYNSSRKRRGVSTTQVISQQFGDRCPRGHPYPEDRKPGAWCKVCSRIKRVEKSYGLSWEQYEALLQKQVGRCAICSRDFDQMTPHVDHDHVTGAVRGLLCAPCNSALGNFQDDPVILRTAIAYLERPDTEVSH